MAVSRKYLLGDIAVPLVAGMVTPLLALCLAVPVLRFFFGPEVRRVDPAELGELRTIGRVVGERTETFHEYKSSYVDITFLVVHLGGGPKGDVLDEVERVKPNGWEAEEWGPRELELVPPRKTSTLVTVQPAEMADFVDSDFRAAAVASKLPLDEMVYVTLTG